MKKEIKKLLAMTEGHLRISKIAKLHRWKVDGMGDQCDRLEITFDSPTGRVSFYTAEIESRDVEGIIAEVAQQTKAFGEKWAAEEAKKVLGGNIDGTIW